MTNKKPVLSIKFLCVSVKATKKVNTINSADTIK